MLVSTSTIALVSAYRRPMEACRRSNATYSRATAYAVLQGEELGGSDREESGSSEDEEDEEDDVMEQDILKQSIEAQKDESD